MKRIKPISKYLLAIFMIVVGMMHFVNPEFFLKIVPPYLPIHKELVLASGVCEILLGVLLLIPKCSHLAAWGIIALLIAAVRRFNLHIAADKRRDREAAGNCTEVWNRNQNATP